MTFLVNLSSLIGRRSRLRTHLGRARIEIATVRARRAALRRLEHRERRATVCVAIPVRNGAAYLASAIESVLRQEGVEVELRVYDNGSSDGSLEIARRYLGDGRVAVVQNERDLNYYGSLNRALDETEAEYFVPFAADDVMLAGNLAIKVVALEKYAAAFAHSRGWFIDTAGARSALSGRFDDVPVYLPVPEILALTLPNNFAFCQAVVARSAVLRAIGGFDARCVYCADWLAWMLLALEHGVVTIELALIEARLHDRSGTTFAAGAGYFARDLPAALVRVLEHPACPAELTARRHELLARVYETCADSLAHSSRLRLADGWAAYAYAGLALAEEPHRQDRVVRYVELIQEAGLAVPRLPLEAVAAPSLSPGALSELASACGELQRSGMLRELTLVVAPEAGDGAVRVIEETFGREPGVSVGVVAASAGELFLAGRVLLAPYGDHAIVVAEAAGIPVLPYALPSPFAEPPDAMLWQTARTRGVKTESAPAP